MLSRPGRVRLASVGMQSLRVLGSGAYQEFAESLAVAHV
jgi:hypothetical protein